MIKAYLLVGYPGSGKSTWAREKVKAKKDNMVIVNRDSLRTMFKGTYEYEQEIEPLVKSAAENAVTAALDYSYNIIIDETNLTVEGRKRWVGFLKTEAWIQSQPLSVEVVHFTESQMNVPNRMTDDPRGCTEEHWRKVITKMKEDFEEPTLDEFPDGTVITRVAI
jgi:tRNA uridine 5-carbamoylmethylation protein Kti12